MKSLKDVLNQINEKIFQKWKINLINEFDSIIFKIENDLNIYESKFDLKYLLSFKLLSSYNSIEQMINNLLNFIDNNKIKIEEKDKNIEFIIISKKRNIPSVELIIKEKNKLSEEIIEKLIREIKNLKYENKELENRIIKLEKKDNEDIKKKDIVTKENINENKINEIEKKIHKLEKQFNKNKIQLTHCNFIQTNSINPHNDTINNLITFPSGNIISVSFDKTINIYNNKFNIIQKISNAHDDYITDVSIKDENNFVTCSSDKNIKIWIKMINYLTNEYSFNLSQIINNAHDDWINKVIYCLNGNIFSCSRDNKIKIWEENNNNNYQCIKILSHNDCVYSILFIDDKNILISSGLDGTKFWNLKNYECIIYNKQAICCNRNALKIIDDDRIIIGGDYDGIIKVISIKENKIIKDIKNNFVCYGICVIEDKGLFLTGGESKEIRIYRIDNYECIKIIKDAHNDDIFGINELNDCSIASYGFKIINIWSFS